MSRRVLVVEDDDALARVLCDNLVYDGFAVERTADAPGALAMVRSFVPDLVLLDLMLPGGDGFEVCRELAGRPSRPPIVILSARGRQQDKVRGLRLGADDYVAKPFDLEELLARIHAVLRRGESRLERLALGDVVVDFQKKAAWRSGSELPLSHRELQVLQHLAERAGRVVTRDELLQAVWGYRETPLTRAVDIAVARLRRKIEPDPRHPRFIRTLHGDGYCLTP
jgi:DNA-binding response OmpR family regulator